MKNLIYTSVLFLGFASVSFSQNEPDQNPNFTKSLVKYDLQKDKASAQQGVTIQDTYVVKDWREVKEKEKEVKATRKYELKKLRIETNARNRRLNNQYNYNRYNRSNRNYYSYYNY